MGSSTALQARRYKSFLDRLRQAREDAGLTQVELAKALRRSQTWVSKCELGERRVDFVELEDLATARIDRLVSGAKVAIDSNLALVQTAWNSAVSP